MKKQWRQNSWNLLFGEDGVFCLFVCLFFCLQLAQAEKEEILLFESHLAAATTKVTITESNSLLLSQLISMDPV